MGASNLNLASPLQMHAPSWQRTQQHGLNQQTTIHRQDKHKQTTLHVHTSVMKLTTHAHIASLWQDWMAVAQPWLQQRG